MLIETHEGLSEIFGKFKKPMDYFFSQYFFASTFPRKITILVHDLGG